ncbi:MAG: motif family protein, partial [Acidobacteriota bacterium]|nr:motif family protein [Acidobacteriota bacterium]
STVALATTVVLAQQSGGTDQGKGHGQHREWGGGGRGGERGGRGFGGEMFGELNLTDAQKAQMKQLHQSFAESTKSWREQLRAKHEEMRQAEAGGTFNEALATQKLTEAAGIEAKLMGAEFNLRQQMLSVLTPEQKAQMEQRRAEAKQRREQFKANGGGGRHNDQKPQQQ